MNLADHVAHVASSLTIMDRATAKRSPWKSYDEQRELWRLLAEHRQVVVAKPRKVGATTAGVLWDVLETDAADHAGDRFVCLVAIDTDDKAKELCDLAKDFCRQLKRKVSGNSHEIVWPNGSRIVFVSAGAHNPARSGTPHRAHLTELPFWADPQRAYNSIISSLSDNASVLIETTFDVVGGPFPRDLWRGQTRDPESGRIVEVAPGMKRHFFSVEAHDSYRADERLITDEQWEECSDKHGFTMRSAAAWWLAVALPGRVGGDMTSLMHDFPQRPEHLFAVAAGREIKLTPKIAPVYDTLKCIGKDGEQWTIDIYGDPVGRYDELSGRVVVDDDAPLDIRRHSRLVFVTVDTRGAGKSRGTVVVGDGGTGRLLGCLASDRIEHDDLAACAQVAADFWRSRIEETSGERTRVVVLIENNGIGRATCTEARRIGLEHAEVDQSPTTQEGKSESAMCLLAAKRAIELTTIADGPPELAEECDELRRDERGNLVGRKDVLMSIGMYLRKRTSDGLQETESEEYRRKMEQRMRMRLDDAIAHDMLTGSNFRPKWGI